MVPRSPPPLKLLRSPLIFVLAQVKIAPVLAIEEKIPALQESLRKSGYPRLTIRQIQLPILTMDGQMKLAEPNRQWEFTNKENTASITVDSEGITHQVTRYDVFESFMRSMEEALSMFAEHVAPGLMSRVGLRYVDLVVPAAGKEIQDYFSESLRGFQIHSAAQRDAFFTESISSTGPASKFIHRYVEASRGFGFPPDLLPISLKFKQDRLLQSPFGLLDMDHYTILDEDFSIQTALSHFFTLHEHQTKAFRASITDAALEEWKTL
jgi:uncharacterized protein (TIGR04255 family)